MPVQVEVQVQVQQGWTPASDNPRLQQFEQLAAAAPERAQAIQLAQRYLARCQDPAGAIADPGATGARQLLQTSLAMLALQATGSTLRSGEHRNALKNSVRWLIARQDGGGDAGEALVLPARSIAAWALAENFVLSDYETLRPHVNRLLEPVLAEGERGDSALVAQALALIAADASGKVPATLVQATRQRLQQLTAANGRIGWLQPGGPPPASLVRGQAPSPVLETATAIGLFARLLGGEGVGAAALQPGIDLLRHSPPRWDDKAGTVDPIYWCFGAFVAGRVGGDCWQAWQRDLDLQVLPRQVGDGDAAGSWPALGPWAEHLGRVGTTALVAMALQVRCAKAPPPK